MTQSLTIKINLSGMELSGIDALGVCDALEEQMEESGTGVVSDRLCATDGCEIELVVSSNDLAGCESFVRGLLSHCDLLEHSTLLRE